jgi:TRAP-type C4-dicarboxylate transport system permease small subunit
MRFGPRVRAALDLISVIALGVFVAIVTWFAWDVFFGSWERDARSISPMRTPLWIPQFFWFVGLAVFMLTFAILLLRSLIALFAGDLVTLRRLIGARTVDEEVQEELSGSAALAHKEG